MKLIAHRGLIDGPEKTLENNPIHIQQVCNMGFECEVDLRVLDGEFFLGHDYAQYKIDKKFLFINLLWIHAKNSEALFWLSSEGNQLNYFWHNTDDYTLTSKGYIWAYPGKPLSNKSIMVMPEWNYDICNNIEFDCHGVCSDYIFKIKDRL